MCISVIALLAALKYVFLFVGDGMSVPQRTVAEEFSLKTGGGPLAMNALPYRVSVRTGSANSLVTDSAAAATAIACGEKTDNCVLGLAKDGRRLESVAELAKKRGMKVGIITTVTINHATPGAFYAHRKSRGMSYCIGLDLVASRFDYFAGGGLSGGGDDRENPEYRGNIYELAKKSGYTVTRTREEWEALEPGGMSWSVFGDGGLDFEIDRVGKNPALHELLEKGISLLDNPDGFFIMCEGGKIDYAGHANDAAANLRDVLALDKAVKTALAFLDSRPDETLVIVTGDHETGGMSPGFAGTGNRFDVEMFSAQKVSVGKFSGEIKNFIANHPSETPVFDDVKPLLAERFGMDSFSGKELEVLVKAFDQDVRNVKNRLKDTTAHDVKRRYVFAQAVKNVLSARAGIGWTTHSHTALPVLTTAKGVRADILVGMKENSDIGIRLKELISGKTE